MECLEPIRIRYGEDYIYVPCGHCKACALNKQSDWATRLEFESKSYPKQSVLFVGLSYNDEHLPEYGSLCKRDLQLFMKRLRKWISPRKCRFFAAGEYGDQHMRPHFHVILFGVTMDDLKTYQAFWSNKVKGFVSFSDLWSVNGKPIGRITIQRIRTIHFAYVAKYATKRLTGDLAKSFEDYSGLIPEFVQMSRNPGIGREECMRRIERLKRDGAIWIKPGVYKRLPRYFVDIVFSDKDGVDYLDWRSARLAFALEAARKWNEEHPGLTYEEARKLKRQQTEQKIKNIERRNNRHVQATFYDIFKKSLERCVFESFNSFFERKAEECNH